MTLIIGAPVHERAWILQDWLDHLAEQEDFPPNNIEIVVNYGPSSDDTIGILRREDARGRFKRITVLYDIHDDHVGPRVWSTDRYATMVRLRNDLLAYVRTQNPDFYLSCDTDMLLPPHTLRMLFAHLSTWNGIAPLTWMTPEGMLFPNCMALDGSRPAPPSTTLQQYAIFGTVLMDRTLYTKVDYSVHGMGEDLGWARSAWEQGLGLAICPDVRIKHVMNEGMLGVIDPRIGF